MTQYLEQFSEKMDISPCPKIRRVLVIASSQRSGSHLLGHTLRDCGTFGVPLEYFNESNSVHWHKRFGTTNFIEILDRVERLRTSANGIFSIKAHYFQLGKIGSIENLVDRYKDVRFVNIERRDMVSQALSRCSAIQSGVWMAGQKMKAEPYYDREAIAKSLHAVARQRMQWQVALAMSNVPWIQIFLEDLLQDSRSTITKIARLMDIDFSEINLPAQLPLGRQSTSKSEDWAARFRNEYKVENNPLLLGRGGAIEAGLEFLRRMASNFRDQRKLEIWTPSPNLIN